MSVSRASSAPPRRERPVSRVVRRSAGPLAESNELPKHLPRCAMLVEESLAYWEHIDPRSSPEDRLDEARRDRWFGPPQHPSRISNLLTELAARFDAFPHALRLLQSIALPPASCPLVCHVHFALADVRYRRFTGEYLADRRERGLGAAGVEQVAEWIAANERALGRPSSHAGLAKRLLVSAGEAGLIEEDGAPRAVGPPELLGMVVAYVLYLLREIRFSGTLLENAYLRGLGVTAENVRETIEAAPGVRMTAGWRAGDPEDGVELAEAGMLEWGERYLEGA